MRWDDWLLAGLPLLVFGVNVFLFGRHLGIGSPQRRRIFLAGFVAVIVLAPSALAIRLVNVYQRGVLDGIHATMAAQSILACRDAPAWAHAIHCPEGTPTLAPPAPQQRL